MVASHHIPTSQCPGWWGGGGYRRGLVIAVSFSSAGESYPRGLQALPVASRWPELGHMLMSDCSLSKGMGPVWWVSCHGLSGSATLVPDATQNWGFPARRKVGHRATGRASSFSWATSHFLCNLCSWTNLNHFISAHIVFYT